MQTLILSILIFSFVMPVYGEPKPICSEDDEASKVANAVCVFSKPLLVGASLTRGQGANPGGASIMVAEKLSPNAVMVGNISQSGARSVISLKNHTIPTNTPSVVMGIDLFFWDAAKNKCGEEFEASTKNFIKMYQDKNIPMVLGKLPKGISFPSGYGILNSSPCTDIINKLLEAECTIEKNCLIYDPKDCISEIKPKNRNKYFVDKLHTSVAGNKFCAKEFIAAKKYQDLKCKLAE